MKVARPVRRAGRGNGPSAILGTAPRSDPYIIGARNASAIGTLVERTTRYLLLVHLPDGYTAEAARDGLIATIETLPRELRRSLTWDQGGELARHAEIRCATDMDIYFCDPGKPWQRGTNENTNGLLRQYFAKGTDLKLHDAAELQRIAAELNSRPRKTLGWATPATLASHVNEHDHQELRNAGVTTLMEVDGTIVMPGQGMTTAGTPMRVTSHAQKVAWTLTDLRTNLGAKLSALDSQYPVAEASATTWTSSVHDNTFWLCRGQECVPIADLTPP